jgi:glutamate synthase domain-containing protein 3
MTIDASGLDHRTFNEKIKAALAAGEKELDLINVCGHRYIGCGIIGDATLRIQGIPGNDLAAFMSGLTLLCSGNVQDAVANTMDDGRIVVPGLAGDVLGYSMRGGRVFVRGNAGYRIGIHMKSYMNKEPIIVIGGRAKDFAGEYMAGGKLIILGLDTPAEEPLVGRYCGSGMHGGAMYVRGEVPDWTIGKGVSPQEPSEADLAELREILGDYCATFELNLSEVMSKPFVKLSALSVRPHGRLYAY